MVQQSLVGQGLTIAVLPSYPDKPYLAGLLRSGDQPDNTQHPQGTKVHAPSRFEPAFQSSEWPQTHSLDRAATGISFS